MPGQDLELVLARRQRHRQLEQEPVELGLGQRVGALVLDRVLGGGDHERVGQRPGRAVDGDLPLLHRLQQRGLGLGRGAVDLVGEQQVGEDRARAERELRGAGVVDQRAGDVAGHQVGRELHALGVQRQRGGQRAHQQRLGDAGHALEQHVAAAQQRDHQAGDGGVLADHGLGHLGAQRDSAAPGGLAGRARRAGGAWLVAPGGYDSVTCCVTSHLLERVELVGESDEGARRREVPAPAGTCRRSAGRR